jgi:DNA-binding NtrC family response regulator
MTTENDFTQKRSIIALINLDDELTVSMAQCDFRKSQLMHFKNGMHLFSAWKTHQLNISAIISQDEVLASSGITLFETLKKNGLGNIPFFLIVNHFNNDLRKLAMNAGVADIFQIPVKAHTRSNTIPVRGLRLLIRYH